MSYTIETMMESDWPEVREIYEQGIATGNATLEQAPPEWPRWNAEHLEAARFVARGPGRVLGWAALSRVSGRCVYAGVAEVSVYIREQDRSRGIGLALLTALVADSERNGIWSLQAGILPENEASVALHRKAGFRIVGKRERLGKLNGVWRDVLLLERRSQVVGT